MDDKRRLPTEESPNGAPPTTGFEVVRSQFFSQSSEAVLSFGRLKMWVNSVCLKKFPETDYVQILVNSSLKSLVLYPSQENARDALPWCSSGSGRRKPRQLSCPIFFAKIFALMEWNPDYRYCLTGKRLCENEEELLAFDLRSAEAFLYSGDMKWRYTPHFPVDWRDRFGTSASGRSMEPLVHIFQEYAVFELETPSVKLDALAIPGVKGEDEICPNPIPENYTT